MAKKQKKPAIRRRRGPQREMSAFGPFLVFGLVITAVINHHAAIVATIGLVPTIVLGFTGRGEHKSQRLQCVGYTNLAGVLPFIPLVVARNDSQVVIGDIFNIVAMFGSAAIGYALIYVGPMVASYILQSLNQDRVKKIAQQRQALVDMWGHEVLGDKDEEVGQNTPLRRQA